MKAIEQILNEGVLVDRQWLNENVFDITAIDYYIRSKTLQAVSRGVYRKPGPPLKWQNIVYSINSLGYSVHVGHIASLQFHGFTHYLELSGTKTISLYCDRKLPQWTFEMEIKDKIQQVSRSPFSFERATGLDEIPFGTWDWPIRYSIPERAFMELLSTVDSATEIQQADKLFEGAANLRPSIVQEMMEQCRQVKAKRLFLWLAMRHDFSWFKKLDISKLDLGKGKRQIVKDGILDKNYLITIPKEMVNEQTESLF
jgi:hypothetical protein